MRSLLLLAGGLSDDGVMGETRLKANRALELQEPVDDEWLGQWVNDSAESSSCTKSPSYGITRSRAACRKGYLLVKKGLQLLFANMEFPVVVTCGIDGEIKTYLVSKMWCFWKINRAKFTFKFVSGVEFRWDFTWEGVKANQNSLRNHKKIYFSGGLKFFF
jgi:hypothetical protein